MNYTVFKTHMAGGRYVVRRGGADYASIAFEGFCRTTARVTMLTRQWTFRRSGLLKPVVGIRSDDGSVVLFAPMRFTGACEVTIDGTTYRWRCTNLWQTKFAWIRDGEPVIRGYARAGFGGCREFETLSNTVSPQTQDLLVALGAYLMIVQAADTAASTAAVMASIFASG